MEPNAAEKVTVKPVGQTGIERTNKVKLVWALIALIAPTSLFILCIIFSSLNNFVFGEFPPIHIILNIIIFLLGTVSVLTWLPGVIVGTILLATRKPVS